MLVFNLPKWKETKINGMNLFAYLEGRGHFLCYNDINNGCLKGGRKMEKKVYQVENGPKAVGPYSIAASAGDLLFISGQIPMVPSSGEIKTDASVAVQARQCLEN